MEADLVGMGNGKWRGVRKVVLNMRGSEKKCSSTTTTHPSLCSSISCHGHHVLRQHVTTASTLHSSGEGKSKKNREVMWHTHTHLAATHKEMSKNGVCSFQERSDKREKAYSSCMKAALMLIYISRNTAARGGGSTGLWDALNVRYQQW